MRLRFNTARLIAACAIGVLITQATGEQAALRDGAGAPAADGACAMLDGLARLPGQFQVLQCSSHNKTGHNGDENWPLYKDERGDDVIFDAAGPGCIMSIWGTHFDENAILNFYFDGETEPRYRIGEIDYFSGKHPAIPEPLVS